MSSGARPSRYLFHHQHHQTHTLGDVNEANNLQQHAADPLNSSVISMESKDTAVSSITMEHADQLLSAHHLQQLQIRNHEPGVAASEPGVATSIDSSLSVTKLRGWLDEFGKQRKDHFDKSTHTPYAEELDKPTRPKVHRSDAGPQPPTPLMPKAANALVKRMMVHDPANRPPSHGIAKSVPGLIQSSSSAHAPKPSAHFVHRPRATPVRFKPKIDHSEVAATNEGYASVAKLSAWLADDPTSKKKIKQIRRGANVIAKSRTFDKGLANVIVEQSNIRTGMVAETKMRLHRQSREGDAASHHDEGESMDATSMCDDAYGQPPEPMEPSRRRVLELKESASSISVTDKKKWLAGAFKKMDEADALPGEVDDIPAIRPSKAKTEVVTGQEGRREELTSRTKEMWRSRTPARRLGPSPPSKKHNVGPHSASAMASKPMCERHDATTLVRQIRFERGHVDEKTRATTKAQRRKFSAVPDNIGDYRCVRTNMKATIPLQVQQSHKSVEKQIALQQSQGPRPWVAPESNDMYRPRTGTGVGQLAKVPPMEKEMEIDQDDSTTSSSIPEAVLSDVPTRSDDSEESNSSFAFQAARDRLVERSKKNGHDVTASSKVLQNKAKFQRLEMEARKRAKPAANGHLKATWSQATSSTSSDKDIASMMASSSSRPVRTSQQGYVKKYVEDVPPKRSLNELP